MSNFDFLKTFNNDLYKIGVRLEDDVQTSPRAVTADATTFLELLVDDIYNRSDCKKENFKVPFYKKIDKLYRSGEISYVYKKKLQNAYSLRSEIHNNYKDIEQEFYIALDLHQKLYYIAKKYYRDYNENYNKYIGIPSYRPPKMNNIETRSFKEFHFPNCIICGDKNENSDSNMCERCNSKIENANYYISLRNTFGKNNEFTKRDLIEYGIPESYALSLIMDLTKENLVWKMGEFFSFNNDVFDEYLSQINSYIEISILINKFYNDELTPREIKRTPEYHKGLKGHEPFVEFHNLVNDRLIRVFERSIINLEDIKTSIDFASISYDDVLEWFCNEKNAFMCGELNDAFINFNELLIEDYLSEIKKGCFDEEKIKQKLNVTPEIYDFWMDYYIDGELSDEILNVKKILIIDELSRNKTLIQAIASVDMTSDEFKEIYGESKKNNDSFYRSFMREYVEKRQVMILKYLKRDNLTDALRKARIAKKEFHRWYFDGEVENSRFYLDVTQILMDKYLDLRKKGLSCEDILKEIKVPRDIFESWSSYDNQIFFSDFMKKAKEIDDELEKRDLIIDGLRNDKSLDDILNENDMSYDEFKELYDSSRIIGSSFHRKYDIEHVENKKRVFLRYLRGNDFFNAIVKSRISHKEFNDWYTKEERSFLSRNDPSQFYLTATTLLMDKYIAYRLKGNNKGESSKNIGLTNTAVTYWMKHPEVDLFAKFKDRVIESEVKLIRQGFNEGKSKMEISDTYDIAVKDINDYIEKGLNDSGLFGEIAEIYYGEVVSRQLEVFLEEVENKDYKKALKNSNFTSSELEECYQMGKDGDERYREFYEKYLDLKINIFITDILMKKPRRIALKNSNLSEEEFEENEEAISDSILNGRLDLMLDAMLKPRSKGTSLASAANISLEEVYDWYFKGKKGDERFEEFSICFDLSIVIPRKAAFNRGINLGLYKNRMLIKLKKDLGKNEFEIWKKHGIIENKDVRYIDLNDEEKVDMNMVTKIIRRSKKAYKVSKEEDPELFQYMKNAFKTLA
ncbi:hypothetical protein [Methanobrevibacter millerae]|uniref:Uncharacterized protein n=1 Tax=Methanobrevibacter millerae TaxID=230361 RepID=A0A1G5VK89_9EURY|nr:hypothetical protein [Methanobrevibacter millerae]SDA46230.1 hypothetical protein SAMN02910315_00694 [Methanobrevibacter millerae]